MYTLITALKILARGILKTHQPLTDLSYPTLTCGTLALAVSHSSRKLPSMSSHNTPFAFLLNVRSYSSHLPLHLSLTHGIYIHSCVLLFLICVYTPRAQDCRVCHPQDDRQRHRNHRQVVWFRYRCGRGHEGHQVRCRGVAVCAQLRRHCAAK